MNKKGWIKIVEAFLAIVLLAGVILAVYNSQPRTISNTEIQSIESSLIDEISENTLFRNDILDNKATNIESFIASRIPGNLGFAVKICSLEEICNVDVYQKEIYAKERIISSTLQEYSPKKLKIFIWMK